MLHRLFSSVSRSLRAKFLIPLLLGAAAVAAAGSWLAYRTTVTQLEDQLVQRARLLASSVNHAAMVAASPADIQHVVERIIRDEAEVEAFVIALRDPKVILAAASREWGHVALDRLPDSNLTQRTAAAIQKGTAVAKLSWSGLALDRLPDAHLREHIVAGIEQGQFGRHYDAGGEHFLLVTPLGPHVSAHGHHGGPKEPRHQMAPPGNAPHDHKGAHGAHDHGAETKPAPGTAGGWLATKNYRGAILLKMNTKGTEAAISTILWRLFPTLLAGVAVPMFLALLLLQRQVLAPVGAIRRAMTRQKSGDATARAPSLGNDEFGDVARTFNEMLDVLDHHRSEIAKTAANLNAALIEARGANRSKTEFLANVSHELRTPLNAIIGFSEIIHDEIYGPITPHQYREYAGDIRDSGRHLLDLINDILDVSKIEAGKLELHESVVEVGAIVETTIRIVKPRADAGNLELTVNVPDVPPALYADERALKQILLNLLSNAVKFTPEGGRVTVAVRGGDRGEISISVSDTGIGIAAEEIPRVLQPFRQVDSALNREYEGTGLGLSLAKSLVELHGGRLELESELGAGTIVTAVFPGERIVRPGESRQALRA